MINSIYVRLYMCLNKPSWHINMCVTPHYMRNAKQHHQLHKLATHYSGVGWCHSNIAMIYDQLHNRQWVIVPLRWHQLMILPSSNMEAISVLQKTGHRDKSKCSHLSTVSDFPSCVNAYGKNSRMLCLLLNFSSCPYTQQCQYDTKKRQL